MVFACGKDAFHRVPIVFSKTRKEMVRDAVQRVLTLRQEASRPLKNRCHRGSQ
jgi:hypothetical protein